MPFLQKVAGVLFRLVVSLNHTVFDDCVTGTMQGSPFVSDDLLRAGVRHASHALVFKRSLRGVDNVSLLDADMVCIYKWVPCDSRALVKHPPPDICILETLIHLLTFNCLSLPCRVPCLS